MDMSGNKSDKMKLNMLWIFTLLLFARGLAASSVERPHSLETFGWRMDGTGCYSNASPPTEWSATKNVLWSAPLPNWSNASPVLAEDKLFVCAEPETLLCIDTADGKILWQKANPIEDTLTPDELEKTKKALLESAPIAKELSEAEKESKAAANDPNKIPGDETLKKKADDLKAKVDELKKRLDSFKEYIPPRTQGTNGYSSSTPATDGKKVFAVFGNGVAACYALDGTRVWIRKVSKPANEMWGHSASPVLAGQKLVVHLSDMQALNPATGETIWIARVPSAFGTPAVARLGDGDALITAAGNFVRASDGKVLVAAAEDVLLLAADSRRNCVLYQWKRWKSVEASRKSERDIHAGCRLPDQIRWRAEGWLLRLTGFLRRDALCRKSKRSVQRNRCNIRIDDL